MAIKSVEMIAPLFGCVYRVRADANEPADSILSAKDIPRVEQVAIVRGVRAEEESSGA